MANPTDIEICNLALLSIGEEPIISLLEASRPARICNAFYDITFKTIIREYNWNELKKSLVLYQSYPVNDYTYSNRYDLPNDFIRILNLKTNDLFEISGNSLYTNAVAPIKIEYIHQPSDTVLLPPLFIEIFYYTLALKLVISLTGGNLDLVNFLENKLSLLKSKAFSINAIQNNTDDGGSDWINSRGGNYGK